MLRVLRPALAAALAAAVVGACAEDDVTARFDVEKRESAIDSVVPIRIEGLPEDSTVRVRSELTADGVQFQAEAEYRVDASGTVDLSRDPSAGGDYEGVFPMGVLAMMQPVDDLPPDEPWPTLFPEDGREIQLTALVEGESVAETSIVRHPHSSRVQMREASMPEDGFVGHVWLPKGKTDKPAVLIIGGAGGGLAGDLEAQALASRGYPALGIAYFGADGLPDSLSDVPMEYFETVLQWFADQPAVDPARIVLTGSSAGTQVALFLAARHPKLVRAVAAQVPSNLMTCGPPSCQRAWTVDGETVPFVTEFGPDTDKPAAAIKVERIRGPIFTVCGGADLVWPSCPMAEAITDRRQQHGVGQDDVALSYPEGGHSVGAFPNTPTRVGDDTNPVATAKARADAWPQYLDFLARLG